jgi:uncharacterized protein YcbK (DUF882 family)
MNAQNPRMLLLAPNFRLGEFLHADEPIPAPWILDNLYRLANRLQAVRDLLEKPILINSGYRNPAHNKAVGGASQSLHLSGMAADIVVPGMTAADVQAFLRNWSGGLGCYTHYAHVDIRPSRARWGDAWKL